MWGSKGHGFSAVFVINRLSSLSNSVINRVWLVGYGYSLDMGMFLKRTYLFIIFEQTINKCPSQILFNIGVN